MNEDEICPRCHRRKMNSKCWTLPPDYVECIFGSEIHLCKKCFEDFKNYLKEFEGQKLTAYQEGYYFWCFMTAYAKEPFVFR